MKKLRIASLMAVFVFLVISASAQKKYTLRVNPDSGKKISQNLVMTMDIDAAGQKMVTDLNMGFDITNTTKKDNTFAFDLKYTGINMKMNMAGMDMSYDSKKNFSNHQILSRLYLILPAKMTKNHIHYEHSYQRILYHIC